MYAETTAITPYGALLATDSAIYGLGQIIGSVARRDKYFLTRLPLLFCSPGTTAREALGQDAVDRRGDQERLDAHLDEPSQRACRVVGVKRRSTRCPVSADSTAICAVSWSRISPTRMMSGEQRRKERSRGRTSAPPGC